ncbi:hypothetical protein QJQ45_007631 [Haematococcus lacustris]|nr:hypothetical protein QJQ45_007631 [Haematococcus lacustris]
MQRIWESKWRPLELCWWPEQAALPAKGKDYPGLGYKRLLDKPPKTQPAVAQVMAYGQSDMAYGHTLDIKAQPYFTNRSGKGIAEQYEFVFDPATQMGVGIDPGESGQLIADQLDRRKLTKGQVKHASGLNNSRRDTQRWLAPIQPHLQHPAAASSAGTSLVANLKHITVTLATWTLSKRSKRTKVELAAEPTQPTEGKGKGKAAEPKPAPQPGRWLDRDCNAALNMQSTGEMKRPQLELCW